MDLSGGALKYLSSQSWPVTGKFKEINHLSIANLYLEFLGKFLQVQILNIYIEWPLVRIKKYWRKLCIFQHDL